MLPAHMGAGFETVTFGSVFIVAVTDRRVVEVQPVVRFLAAA